jgi:hypothetical protein
MDENDKPPKTRPRPSDIESDRVFQEPAEIRALEFDEK